MRKVLVAVSSSKGSDACVKTCARVFSAAPPKSVILLHVQQLGGGPTVIHERMSDAEIETLKEELERTDGLDKLHAQSRAILTRHRKKLERRGIRAIKTIVKTGHVAQEILDTAKEEKAELIIIGNTRGLLERLMMGDVAKTVAAEAGIPVLLAR